MTEVDAFAAMDTPSWHNPETAPGKHCAISASLPGQQITCIEQGQGCAGHLPGAKIYVRLAAMP
jgi:hypothetical protein